jgi:hypothetical protein
MNSHPEKTFQGALPKEDRMTWTSVESPPLGSGLYEVARADIFRVEFMEWDGQQWYASLVHVAEDYSHSQWDGFIEWSKENCDACLQRDWSHSFWRRTADSPKQDEQDQPKATGDTLSVGTFVSIGSTIYDTPRAKLLIDKVVFGDGDITVKELRKSLGIVEPSVNDKNNIMKFFR